MYEDDGIEYKELLKRTFDPKKQDIFSAVTTTIPVHSTSTLNVTDKGDPITTSIATKGALGIDLQDFDEFLTKTDTSIGVLNLETTSLKFGKLRNLLTKIEHEISDLQERRKLRQLLADFQPTQSKWVREISFFKKKTKLDYSI